MFGADIVLIRSFTKSKSVRAIHPTTYTLANASKEGVEVGVFLLSILDKKVTYATLK